MRSATLCLEAADQLAKDLRGLSFGPPVTHVYNPLEYAREAHAAYLERYAQGPKRVLFLGMNPGPFGMAQTGVPFGEIPAVRDWLGIEAPVGKPKNEHAARPIQGFACPRSEVSGRRLWGLFAERFGSAKAFFEEHFVANYCPLVFMESSGKNRTPDKLAPAEMRAVYAACDRHLRRVIEALEARWVIGVGGFAEGRALAVAEAMPAGQRPRVGRILHPSPASPAANRDWPGQVQAQMKTQGLW